MSKQIAYFVADQDTDMMYYMIYNDKENTTNLVSSLVQVMEVTGISKSRLWAYFNRGTVKNPVRLVFQEYPFTITRANSLEKQRRDGSASFTKNKQDW